MSITLSQGWRVEHAQPSSRSTHCKNCLDFENPDPRGSLRPKGAPRIVLSKGLGTNCRTLSLCPDCAKWEAGLLEELAREIRRSLP